MWARQRCQLSAGKNIRLKIWRAFLSSQNNSCLISIPSCGLVWAAGASSYSKSKNIMCRGKLNLLWHYPRGRQKIWLMCWKWKYASQFPSCLSLTNDPSFTFLSGQHGPVSIQETTDLCDIASMTAMKPLRWNCTSHIQMRSTLIQYCCCHKAILLMLHRSCTDEDSCHSCFSHMATSNCNCLTAQMYLIKAHLWLFSEKKALCTGGSIPSGPLGQDYASLCSAHAQSILLLIAHNRSSDRTQFMPLR